MRRAAHAELDGFDRLRIVEPLEVIDFHNFMAASHLVLTDSGGIQEEAPSLGKPVLVMRDTTERPEGVACGTLREFSGRFQAFSQAFDQAKDGRSALFRCDGTRTGDNYPDALLRREKRGAHYGG